MVASTKPSYGQDPSLKTYPCGGVDVNMILPPHIGVHALTPKKGPRLPDWMSRSLNISTEKESSRLNYSSSALTRAQSTATSSVPASDGSSLNRGPSYLTPSSTLSPSLLPIPENDLFFGYPSNLAYFVKESEAAVSSEPKRESSDTQRFPLSNDVVETNAQQANCSPVEDRGRGDIVACRGCRALKIRCDKSRPRRGPDKRPGTRQRRKRVHVEINMIFPEPPTPKRLRIAVPRDPPAQFPYLVGYSSSLHLPSGGQHSSQLITGSSLALVKDVHIDTPERQKYLAADRGAGLAMTFGPDNSLCRGISNSLLQMLANALTSRDSRKALQDLKANRAQTMIDFLHSVILQESLEPWLRKHSLIVLYKLSKNSMMYPRCYALKDISRESQVHDGGGFCDIYRGNYNGQKLSLKVVRIFQKSEVDEALQSFAKEAILWGMLHYPNILPFYGIYYLDPSHHQFCLVSPWMDNGNLVVFLKKNPTLPRKPFVFDILRGFEYLHNENIVHGDLKGVNILVSKSGSACIADFGLSSVLTNKTFASANTTTARTACSTRWIAPELLSQDCRHTRESDVWAFGSVCFEIFTRRLPYFECSNDYQVIPRLMEGKLPTRPLEADTPEFDRMDEEAWDLANRCWAKDPKIRPTFHELLEEFRAKRFAEDHSTVILEEHPESLRFQKAMRRGSDMAIHVSEISQILGNVM
ncbi:hypothetical protein AN958_00959 [Leucoagaricus sp. SymC.cos]|nr:hypothetical protein AN958_00959 [Leucoagaricus sp. SymC.cos]